MQRPLAATLKSTLEKLDRILMLPQGGSTDRDVFLEVSAFQTLFQSSKTRDPRGARNESISALQTICNTVVNIFWLKVLVPIFEP